MKAIFHKLYSGSPQEKNTAFLAIEQALPDMAGLPQSMSDEFVALGRRVEQFDKWDADQRRRFMIVAIFVESSAKRAGLT